jgi:hypothetical protein
MERSMVRRGYAPFNGRTAPRNILKHPDKHRIWFSAALADRLHLGSEMRHDAAHANAEILDPNNVSVPKAWNTLQLFPREDLARAQFHPPLLIGLGDAARMKGHKLPLVIEAWGTARPGGRIGLIGQYRPCIFPADQFILAKRHLLMRTARMLNDGDEFAFHDFAWAIIHPDIAPTRQIPTGF